MTMATRALLLAVAFFAPGLAGADDATAVLDLFKQYKAALLAGDGATAARLVDRETFGYFEEIKELTLSGDEAAVRARPFVDRLLIVTMRHELPAAELSGMDLEGLLEHAIDAGWIGKASIAQLGIGAVTVDGEAATAVAITPGQTPADAALSDSLRYRFVRENGEWRFGFRSLVESINQTLANLTSQMGTDQDALIFMLVEQLSGRKVLPEIWQTAAGTAEAVEAPAKPPSAEAPPPVEPAPPAPPPSP
jgi:hypothetical protein